ncbi:MAG: hypothetical protein P8P17_00145 [Pseudomonadales bacterium]|nr:hypothetical protein [Pseudomonadales bacterium]
MHERLINELSINELSINELSINELGMNYDLYITHNAETHGLILLLG